MALSPNPDYLSLSIGKAGLRAMALDLFKPFKERDVHIATVTVAALVAAGSPETRAIAGMFWDLLTEQKGSWSAEVTYNP